MSKGSKYRTHNTKHFRDNHDAIDWSKGRKPVKAYEKKQPDARVQIVVKLDK